MSLNLMETLISVFYYNFDCDNVYMVINGNYCFTRVRNERYDFYHVIFRLDYGIFYMTYFLNVFIRLI